MILGIVAIIMGLGGALNAVLGLLLPHAGTVSSTTGSPQTIYMYGEPSVRLTVFYVFTFLLAVTLFVSGVLLLRTRPSSDRWFRVWAILKLLHVPFVVYVTVEITRVSMVSSQAFVGPASRPQGAKVLGVINAVMLWGIGIFTFLWSVWGPLFVLWWFQREKVRTDWLARCAVVRGRAA